MSKIKRAKVYRNTAIGEIQLLCNFSKEVDGRNVNIFKARFSDIERIRDEFDRNHTIIIDSLIQEEEVDLSLEDTIREGFFADYYEVKSIYEVLTSDDSRNATNLNSSVSRTNLKSNVRLPKLDLKVFEGDCTQFPTFIGLFNSLVHNNDSLSEDEKFNYLVSILKEQPLKLVQHYALCGDNYQAAYGSLVQRYSNKRLLAKCYWHRLEGTGKIKSKVPNSLRNLLDIFQENICALKTMQFPTDQWDFILLMMLYDRLDDEIVSRFEHAHGSSEVPRYNDLKTFLERECIALEMLHDNKQSISQFNSPALDFSKNSSMRKKTANYFTENAAISHRSDSTRCTICKGNHSIFKCTSFLNMKPFDRYNLVKKQHLCFNCLSNLHDIRSCKSKSTCHHCSLRHHTFLHFKAKEDSKSEGGVPPTTSANKSDSGTLPVVNFSCSSVPISERTSCVLLATALVEVSDSNGVFRKLRCLIDSGSMTSFITKRAVASLALKSENVSLEVTSLNSSKSCISKGLVALTIRPIGHTSPILYSTAAIINKITEKLPTTSVPDCITDKFKNLKLADPSYHVPGHIDILLGVDMFAKIILDGHVVGSSGISAFNSIFGYILMGSGSDSSLKNTSSFFCDVNCQANDNLLSEISKNFWEIESVPSAGTQSPADNLCETIFIDTHKRDSAGKYIVSLPFANVMPRFKGMKELASRRFFSLERRLINDPILYEQYSAFMREYLDCGHMEIVPDNSLSENPYYLIHHCVLKPTSTHTKLRVVFNASAKAPSGFSLNDNLLTGPKLQADIVSILLKFRLHSYVLCSDIKQMYRMIWLNPDHRDYQRIFWRFSPNDPLKIYRLKTVTYGVSSAPFLALRCLVQLAQDEGIKFPLAAKALREDTYIDDVVTGTSSLEEAKILQTQLLDLFEKGGFQLRKWSSNNSALLEALPASMRSVDTLDFNSYSDCTSFKILGLLWNPLEDSFSFSVVPQDNTSCTKRHILSQLARIYDPLGFLSPVTFILKYLIQRLWMLGLTWDEEPPDEILRVWDRLRSQIPSLSEFSIKRHLVCSDVSSLELHGFCDSSEKGYCAVLYLKSIFLDGNISINFIISKSKVAPLKKICIPRLELCGAVLLAKLLTFVMRLFSNKIPLLDIKAWTDSQVVLAWIRSPSYRWKNFVANRVAYIQEKIPFVHWNYVTSANNPADLGSRGLFPTEIINNEFWLEGPKFLCNDQTYPGFLIADSSEALSNDIVCEERKISLFATPKMEHFCEYILGNYSNFSTLLRICAYVLRFVFNTSYPKAKRNGPLSSLELNSALVTLARYTQEVAFSNELTMDKFSKPLRKLNVFKTNDHLLRVGGRLRYSDLPYDTKHPILLPRTSMLTIHLINYYHKKYFHIGARQLHFLLAQQFWILSPRRAINSVLSKCVECFKMKPTAYQPRMGDLPKSRFSTVKAFLHCGCDYAGPFIIAPTRKYRGQKTSKAYICIFVCFSTKALHLELANDLSTESFLSALQRFIARRGRCTDLYCDNGTNFVGANRELINLMQTAAENERLNFHFNPPSGSHFGGLFEAAVKSVKTHLFRVIGAQILTYEEFYTLLTLIESILNSRPLCALSSDPDDLNCLTPGHFLTLEPLSALPFPTMTDQPLNRLSRWQLLQNLHQHFWSRWRKEYLHTLQQRVKWLDVTTPAAIGQLVLIKADNVPPNQWRLGRIVTLFKGGDGISRVAHVKTTNGVLTRPLVKLCPLPVGED